jgi:hypothetical protein
MRLVMNLFAIVGMLGMTANLATKLSHSHRAPIQLSQNTPIALNQQ